MEVVALAEGNHLFGKRTHFLRFRKRCHQPPVVQKIRDHVPQHRAAMRTVPAQLPVCVSMSHKVCSAGAGPTGLPCSSSFMPRERPILERISLISLSDLRPKFFVLSISASVFVTSSPIVRIFAFFRQLYDRTDNSSSSTDLFRCSITAS